MDEPRSYTEIIAQKQQRLREKFPDHTWVCARPDCGAILGLLSHDFSSVIVKARGVHVESEGGVVRRHCAKCGAINTMVAMTDGNKRVFSLKASTVL